jgi:hypothetical protein
VIDPRHQIKRSDADPAQQQDQRLATQNQGINNPQRHDAYPELALALGLALNSCLLVHGESPGNRFERAECSILNEADATSVLGQKAP